MIATLTTWTEFGTRFSWQLLTMTTLANSMKTQGRKYAATTTRCEHTSNDYETRWQLNMRPRVNSAMTKNTNTQRFDTEHHYTFQLLQLQLRLAPKMATARTIWGSSTTNVDDDKHTYKDLFQLRLAPRTTSRRRRRRDVVRFGSRRQHTYKDTYKGISKRNVKTNTYFVTSEPIHRHRLQFRCQLLRKTLKMKTTERRQK